MFFSWLRRGNFVIKDSAIETQTWSVVERHIRAGLIGPAALLETAGRLGFSSIRGANAKTQGGTAVTAPGTINSAPGIATTLLGAALFGLGNTVPDPGNAAPESGNGVSWLRKAAPEGKIHANEGKNEGFWLKPAILAPNVSQKAPFAENGALESKNRPPNS
jgi:hypothetical protein